MGGDLESIAQLGGEPPAELVITLRKPVSFAGQTYGELRLREPTAGETESWDGMVGNAADNMAVSIVSGVPLPAIRMIGARDRGEAARYLARFL